MNSDRVELTREGRLIFHGGCLEMLPVCQGFCCRVYKIIELTPEEYRSGLYTADVICSLNGKECTRDQKECRFRQYLLQKKQDGSCVYQDGDNKCSIQEHKPRVCADFSCQGGWQLGAVHPAEEAGSASRPKLEREAFIRRLTGEMTFISHPLVKLHAVFYNKRKDEITFIKELVGKCGKFYTREGFRNTQLDDGLLLDLIRLLDRKDTLQEVHQRFCGESGVSLSKEEFSEIIWVLNKHNIILSVIHCEGLLAGMGDI